MLYYRALVRGLDDLPSADPAIRAGIDADAAKRGWPALHADLAKVDPVTAARLPPTDAQRIQRALEVFRVTGSPLSSLQNRSSPSLPFQVRAYARMPSRDALHASIEKRFDEMLKQGLVEEVQDLRKRYRLAADMPSMRAVGYRQVWEYLEGEVSRDEMRSRAIAATRQLAKRQMTWLRSFPEVTRLDAGPEALLRLDAGEGHGPAVGLELLLDVGAQALGRARV
jgi:tRNA dimethylallyltransferase